MLKHVVWEDRNWGGRIAVKEEHGLITIKKLAGNNIPAGYLFAILDAALPEWRKAAEELHLSRKHSWVVEKKDGRWGSLTYRLRIVRNVDLIDVPTVASLHVSCMGKLPETIELWLGDLAPLAGALRKDFPQVELPPEEEEGYYTLWCDTPEGGYLKLRVEEPRFVGLDQGVMFPGEPSGLLDPEPQEKEALEEKPQEPIPEVEII